MSHFHFLLRVIELHPHKFLFTFIPQSLCPSQSKTSHQMPKNTESHNYLLLVSFPELLFSQPQMFVIVLSIHNQILLLCHFSCKTSDARKANTLNKKNILVDSGAWLDNRFIFSTEQTILGSLPLFKRKGTRDEHELHHSIITNILFERENGVQHQ